MLNLFSLQPLIGLTLTAFNVTKCESGRWISWLTKCVKFRRCLSLFLFSAFFCFYFCERLRVLWAEKITPIMQIEFTVGWSYQAYSMRMEKSRHFPRLRLALRCKWKLIHKENRFAAFKLRITFQISANFLPEIAFIDLAFLVWHLNRRSAVTSSRFPRRSSARRRWKCSRQTTRTIVEK